VTGELRADACDSDLLRATFPPGSVTGAPKVQAMHVIAELERSGREAYTGGMGYVSPVAGLELNVAIRTLELRDGHLWLGAGGGIVADSDPEQELEEALVKARPIAAAIGTSVLVKEAADGPDPARGVFETMLVREGTVQALELHLARLASSVGELFGARLPDDTAAHVRSLALGLSGEHRLRAKAIPRADGIAMDVSSEPLSLPPPAGPLTLSPALIPGGLGRHKWCDRRILDTFDPGNGVSLIVDQREEVLEAAWANVWIVEGMRLITPPADGRILPGVTRVMLLGLAPQLGLTVCATPTRSSSRHRYVTLSPPFSGKNAPGRTRLTGSRRSAKHWPRPNWQGANFASLRSWLRLLPRGGSGSSMTSAGSRS
jgi:para-aminobenzoate synthetase/4-amino-4-deoxychorismate lyase